MYKKTLLPNGVRIITEEIDHVRSAALGIWVGAGSRDEREGFEGISHFIEHMFFKGTEHRSARALAESLEAVGGQLNAFTTKEYTCYYAKVLDEDLDLAIDVLSDMFFSSLFDEKEIEKEKNVVIEEIKMYEDSPDELIHDVFSEYVWNDHPLGKPILGTEESIRSLSREKIMQFLTEHYAPDNVVISVAGKIKHEDVVAKLSPHFGTFNRGGRRVLEETPKGLTIEHYQKKDTEQMHILLGVPGLGQDDEDIYAMHIFNNILGGGLSSRLFQEIREQRGLAYSVYSYHSTYVDTGLFAVYAGTSPKNTQEVIACILEELMEMKTKGISVEELVRTKAQIKGGLYLGLEAVSSRMSRLGKTELTYNRVLSPEEVVEKLEKVTQEDVLRVIGRLWQKDNISIMTLGPAGHDVVMPEMLKQTGWE
ncbi:MULTISPECIES: M16 family metallopeptidase [Desulfosporosinus]|uniref:Insulinase family protein n=1 Tax=Desulfosporosinus nitroreducens TaxID=2018668 RepID=A0ABT8QU00_9FIRM|nr:MULTISPECIES: pitrilysin family protein [Desulfosporosinus]MCO1601726.1 insulinase family protein [Desulfosporosinus nitroreducens]MCO5388687.1 insulinase family protein [Desulfosporosinus sp.]MDA8221904.1 pitrilysin family protein [Desulfitobacterium hafniense]MDO0824795.1 insulinase family protein [Desulfosporosinus nitroreducens]